MNWTSIESLLRTPKPSARSMHAHSLVCAYRRPSLSAVFNICGPENTGKSRIAREKHYFSLLDGRGFADSKFHRNITPRIARETCILICFYFFPLKNMYILLACIRNNRKYCFIFRRNEIRFDINKWRIKKFYNRQGERTFKFVMD